MKKLFVLFVILSSTNLFPQNWLKVDSIFAVSGVTVQNFSAPEFADLNNDGNPDLILGNIADAADFFWNNSHDFPTTFSKRCISSFKCLWQADKLIQTQIIQHL
ncbi:MAG: hypothetical protein MZV64_05620 [Ignavibacteriales bacterium]|nr:hypothetical protein [Ignavibacteriales bacterium]